MGQRLNIEIKNSKKVLANAYYHWSGYTGSSLYLTEEILAEISRSPRENFKNDKEYAVALLMSTGANIEENQEKYAAKYGISEEICKKSSEKLNRNTGIIAMRPIFQKDTRNYEEARVTIDIDRKIVKFNVLCWRGDLKYWQERNGTNEIPKKCPIKFNKLDFNEVSKATKYYENFANDYFLMGKNVYSFIE